MFFNKNKNRHPAAAGRFASYGEIVSNFACFVYNSKISEQDKAVRRFKNFYYFFAASAVSLILAIIITMSLNADAPFFASAGNPLAISGEYLTLWIILFFILIFAGNKINRPADMRGGFKFSDKNTAAGFRLDKPFELGILKGAGNKKFPDVLIGLDEKKRYEHTLIISPTGGGKTSRYIVPGIAADAGFSDTSVFAIDIDSPYLYGAVKSGWIKAGKIVVHFDPYEYESYDGRKKIYFNPLIGKDKNPLSDEKLLDLSSMLFHLDGNEIKGGDIHAHKYYSKRSSDLFYSCLLYLKHRYGAKHFDLFTIKSFFERGVKFIEGEIVKFNGVDGKGKKIKNLFNNFLELPIYERAKVVTDILNNLDFLNDSKVGSRFKCKEDGDCFFTEDFFINDMLFIAGIPKEKINSGGGRLISFITQIFIDGIYESRRKALREENSDGRSFFIYLDEFPVLTLNDFDVELANLRKTNTGVCLTVQDIAFLKDRYGDISLITSNIGTHIVMGHAGWETCRYYSEMSGERYVFHKELVKKHINPVFASFPSSSDYGETPVASGLYPLISSDELKNMNRNSVFIYTKYVNPFILNLK
jgi:type IV secretory pathway TraG/TraD family ATPase VirD4